MHVPLVSGWGPTETAPLCTDSHFAPERSGVIGIRFPAPSSSSAPSADKMEVRVRGRNVMPGYWKLPSCRPGGLRRGRLLQDRRRGRVRRSDTVRKRACSSTAASARTSSSSPAPGAVGSLRMKGLDALVPMAQDIVVTGHDRDEIGFLIFPNVPELRKLSANLPADASVDELLHQPAVAMVARGLAHG